MACSIVFLMYSIFLMYSLASSDAVHLHLLQLGPLMILAWTDLVILGFAIVITLADRP